MKENEAKMNDDIKTVLEGLSSDDSTVVISDGSSDGKLEFRFESTERVGLVFEEDDTPPAAPVSAAEPAPAPSAPEVEAPAEPVKEEFSLPESFDASAAEQSATLAESTRIWSTYLPRFTEVSETYRMNNDPRPRIEKKEKTVAQTEDKAEENTVDPTSESLEEAGVPDAVLININQKAEEEEQTFSVYKFSESDADESPAEEKRERTVEDERADIEILFHRREAAKPAAEPEPTPVEEEELPASPKSYDLPDPERDGRVHVVDYSAKADARTSMTEAPDGADDTSTIAVKKKGRAAEFTAHMQRDTFKDKFLDSIMSARIRLTAAIILTVAMLVFENIGLFFAQAEDFLRPATFPGMMALADLQFALCVFILALPEAIKAFRALGRAEVLPELLSVASLVVLAVYTLAIILIAPPAEYPLFGVLCAVQSLAAIISACFKRSADFLAFKRVSGNGEKRILDKKMTRSLERENLALDGAVDETKSKTARIFKTTFVSDFFKRSAVTVENTRNVLISLSASLVAALAGAIVAFFVGNGWLDASAVFAAVALFTLPAVSILLHKLPFYHSSLECESEKSAIIGEGSAYEYSGVDVIAFEDTDIFGTDDVNLKRIIHYGDVDNMMKAMRQMSAIFANVGGPLNIIFANSLDRKCSPASNPEIELDGIAGTVDGHTVRAGTADYMRRHGIAIPEGAASSRAGISDSTKVMFGAEDGLVYVQFHIRYSFSEEFTMILPTLKKEKIVPLIYTRDPNISGELVKTLTSGDDCIRVLKKNTVRLGEDKIYRRISAGIVTSGDKIDAMDVILLTKKYVRLMKKLSIVELAAAGAGCVISVALAIAGALGISSVFFFGWHAVWCLALYIVSRNSFTVKKKEEDYNDR